MKTLLFFLLLTLFACTKHQTDDFLVTRIISLKPSNWPDSWKPEIDTIKFNLYDKTQDELLKDINDHTFKKWDEPGDTIWFYQKVILNCGGHQSRYFIDRQYSVYETMSENANAYTCPKY